MLFPIQPILGPGRLLLDFIVFQDPFSLTRDTEDVNGLIDTGANRSVIPLELVDKYNLKKIGATSLTSFDGETKSYPLFEVILTIPQLISRRLKVSASARQDVILGVDFCEHLHLGASWRRSWFGLMQNSHDDTRLHSEFYRPHPGPAGMV